MTNDTERLKGAIRISWCHQTVVDSNIFINLEKKIKNLT
jgi:hypothetical protein